MLGRAPFLKQAGIHHLNKFAVLVGETSLSRKGTAWTAVRNLLEAVDDEENKNGFSNRILWCAANLTQSQTAGSGLD
jgi:hypothetical protein